MHATLTGGMHTVARRAELESAAGLPMQTWGGIFLYPTPYQPFTDGNKRIAWAASIVFLDLNGITVEATVEEVVHLMLGIAAKRSDIGEIAEFLERHTTAGVELGRQLLGEGNWNDDPADFFPGAAE